MLCRGVLVSAKLSLEGLFGSLFGLFAQSLLMQGWEEL